MMKKHKCKDKNIKCCMNCEHCLPIGEGDHWCDEKMEIVLEDYIPSENYLCCGGKDFERR